MSNSPEITNWRERPQKVTEKKNVTPEFRGSPHVYKERYAPTRDVPNATHNPRFNERQSQPINQSTSLRRQDFLNTSPLRKPLDASQHTVESQFQNFLQQFTSNQQSVQPPAGNLNLQPNFQRPQPGNENRQVPQQRDVNIQVPPQFIPPQLRNPIPQQQQRNGNIQNFAVVPQPLMSLQIQPPRNGMNQNLRPQQGVPNFQPQFQQTNGVVHNQRPQSGNRNENKQPQNQQKVGKGHKQQNGNQKSDQQFSGLSESNATKYRDQRIKQMAMNKNEAPNLPKNQQNNSRPNKQNQPHPQPQQKQQSQKQENRNRGRKPPPENIPNSVEFITKDWIVQPIISNEVLIKKFGKDDPKCQQLQKKIENDATILRDKRIQQNFTKTSVENSYKKMSLDPEMSLIDNKISLPKIPFPAVNYYPRKTFVTFRPKHKSHVLLTSATSMNTVFIRSFKINKDYCSVVKAYNEMGINGVPFKRMPELNGMVLTKYKNVWMRAHVTKLLGDRVEVFFTDLGFRDTKTLSELQNVNIFAHTSVTYIHQYRLKNIPEESEKNQGVLQYLHGLYERNFELVTDGVGKECDLIDYQTDESVCSRILNILGIELPKVVEEKIVVAGESDEDLYGPGSSVNVKEDFVDQNQTNSSYSMSSGSEEEAVTNIVNHNEDDVAGLSVEKSKEDHLEYNEVLETYEAESNCENRKPEEIPLQKEDDYASSDLMERSRETIEKPNISEKEVKIETDYSLEPKEQETYAFEERYETFESEDPLLLQNISKAKIQEGKNITVIVSDKSELRDGSLSIMSQTDFKTLKKLQEEIQTYCENDDKKSYKPKEDEVCLVKYSDGKWHRATCLKYLSPTKTVVSFIDFGNLCKVYNVDIKKCPRELYKPCFSVSCFIADLDEVTEEMEVRLNQLIPLDKLIVDELKYVQVSDDEEICVIELGNILRILREEGLMF